MESVFLLSLEMFDKSGTVSNNLRDFFDNSCTFRIRWTIKVEEITDVYKAHRQRCVSSWV